RPVRELSRWSAVAGPPVGPRLRPGEEPARGASDQVRMPERIRLGDRDAAGAEQRTTGRLGHAGLDADTAGRILVRAEDDPTRRRHRLGGVKTPDEGPGDGVQVDLRLVVAAHRAGD